MSRTQRGLDRLQRRLGPGICPGCRGWAASVAVCDDRGRCSRHEVCPGCGRVVPLRRAVVIVGVDLDLV